jgi:hypothetical protein
VPALRDCLEDIPELARHRLLPRWRALDPEAEDLLQRWPYWPGNHRSLHAVLDIAMQNLGKDRRFLRIGHVLFGLRQANLFRLPPRFDPLLDWLLQLEAIRQPVASKASRLELIGDELARNPREAKERLCELARKCMVVPMRLTGPHGPMRGETDPPDWRAAIRDALLMLTHEVFWDLIVRAETVSEVIRKAHDDRVNRLLEGGFDSQATARSLLGNVLLALSEGQLLWRLLQARNEEIAAGNKLYRDYRTAAADRFAAADGQESGSVLNEATGSTASNCKQEQRKGQTAKAPGQDGSEPPVISGSKASDTKKLVASVAGAVLAAEAGESDCDLWDLNRLVSPRDLFGKN